MQILTGLEMGERNENDEFPEGSVNYKVEQRLRNMAEKRKQFTSNGNNGSNSNNE
jgi:hypothetical protein